MTVKFSFKTKCLRSATEEDRWSESETLSDDETGNGDSKVHQRDKSTTATTSTTTTTSTGSMRVATSSGDSLSLGIREPVYEVCFA